jgi:purine nucleosidase
MKLDRRELFAGAGALGLAGLASKAFAAPFAPLAGPRCRVMLVNDLSGDLDGLYAAVHAVLSPTAKLVGIVGAAAGDGKETAAASVAAAAEMLKLMGRAGTVPIHAGASGKLTDAKTPQASPGSDAIIAEAMRDDPLPLVVTVGGGLTEVASALLKEPRIAERMTVIWIGGDPVYKAEDPEYNFNLDRLAAQYLFNASTVRIWQVPRPVYATCLISATELQAYVEPCGAVGKWLYQKVVDFPRAFDLRFNSGETWTMGDSPLVVLSALTDWVPSDYRSGKLSYERTSAGVYDTIPTPKLNPDGSVSPNPGGRPMRLFRSIDTRLMFSDFFAKLAVNYRA